jgi:hypothetical protein
MMTFFLGLGFLITTSLMAQRQCASSTYIDLQKVADPALTSRIAAIEYFIRQENTFAARENGEVSSIIRIPVVVHVVYKNEAQNISDAQINSQIDALNRDFRRLNADSVNTPDRFKYLAADVQIEFVLATSDPSGRPTTGIIRKKTSVNNWMLDDKIKFSAQGGDDAWDSRYYLNIWTGNLFSLLGFSSLPGTQADKDGVVIHYSSFGTLHTPAPYEMGRTAVHEIGHWLGLKHIWGDTYCGDDLVDDTPKQGNFTSGCPNSFRSSCSNGSTGDMYMNYMDYTSDACMNLFTKGQKDRMLKLFQNGGPRNSLLTSKGLLDPWVVETPPVSQDSSAKMVFYPNPVKNEVSFRLDSPNRIGQKISIFNVNGFLVRTLIISKEIETINVASLSAGIYFVQITNGKTSIRQKLVKL